MLTVMRTLTERDRQTVMAVLGREPAYNAFAIGDIENFGFDQPFQDVWAEVDDAGEYRAVILRYFDNNIVYSIDRRFDREAVCETIRRKSGERRFALSGKRAVVDELAPRLGLSAVRRQFLAELRHLRVEVSAATGLRFEWATTETFDEVLALQSTIEEFRDLGGASEGIRKNLETGTGRTVFVRRNDRMVATASSAAESSRAAMIIGVCTATEYRRQGLATACMVELCRALLDEDKIVCLFYDNPSAARIYERLGFWNAGEWAMAMPEG